MANEAPQSPQGSKKGSNKTVMIIIIIVVVLVVLGIIGSVLSGLFAKKVAEKGVESVLSRVTNSDVDLDTKNNSVTIQTGNGTTTIGSQKLPSDFPTDIPVYPDATIIGSVTGSTAEGIFVSMNTTDSSDKVKAYYDAKLVENGWTKEEGAMLGTIVNISATKGDKRLSVVLTPYENDQLHITIATSSK